MFWAEAGGRVVAVGDAAPVAEVVMHWAWTGVVVVYAGERPPGRAVDRLERAEDGSVRRTQGGLVEDEEWLGALRETGWMA